MEIREFAERVLFGQSLDDKLTLPGRLTDERAGAVVRAPGFPGRPPALALDGGRVKARFPGAGQLESPRQRGEVLHFFANHELLALELMALMLLRFPDAPPAFRAGLIGTMIDEQRHMRLYLDRMADCDVELGTIPVSAFFWTCLADAPDLRHFVAGMSLTFEQANLDYSLHYERAFRAAGDEETASVLHRVYEDEVRHVRDGLAWFREWKPEGMSEFEAHAALLRAPLSPARARGLDPDREARRRAGFDDAYIDALEVYARSKGRPPTVRWFEPSVELCVAAGHPVAPSPVVAALTRDLETLPMFLGARDDVVLVSQAPRQAFLRDLAAAGLQPPEFSDDPRALAARQVGALAPWGWGPGVEAAAGPLADGGRVPDYRRWSRAFGKDWSAGVLADLLADWGADWIGGEVAVCDDMPGVRGALARWPEAWIKAPFSASGQGRLRWRGAWEAGQERWVEETLARSERVVVEPHLDAVFEFSVLLRLDGGGAVRRLGFGRSLADSRGQYKASVLGPLRQGLEPAVLRFLSGDGRDPRRLDEVGQRVADAAGRALAGLGFRGLAGVDVMVYRGEGGLLLRPVLEVNPRTTMGHVALGVSRALAPQTVGVMTLISRAQARRAGLPGPGALAAAACSAPTLTRGRLSAGVVALTDPERSRRFAALLCVGPRLSTCRDVLAAAGVRVPGLDAVAAGR